MSEDVKPVVQKIPLRKKMPEKIDEEGVVEVKEEEVEVKTRSARTRRESAQNEEMAVLML